MRYFIISRYFQAFPCIATGSFRFSFESIHFYLKGIYNYPNEAACNVAMKAVREFLEQKFKVNFNHSTVKDWRRTFDSS